jgi:hypothetical protein
MVTIGLVGFAMRNGTVHHKFTSERNLKKTYKRWELKNNQSMAEGSIIGNNLASVATVFAGLVREKSLEFI